jgi:hypothetical protein
MNRVRTLGVLLVLLLASVAFTPARLSAPEVRRTASEDPVLTVGGVSSQLGIKTQLRDDDEFVLGTSITGLLTEPEKLARFGIHMHAGARVTAGRAGLDKIRVEADEMEPVPARASATLRVDNKGVLSAAPKA